MGAPNVKTVDKCFGLLLCQAPVIFFFRYYDKLYKEYVVAELSQYKSGKLGLRWRIEEEVLSGKGESICGALECDERAIKTFEVPFRYKEGDGVKSELVKLRICSKCAKKLRHIRGHRDSSSDSMERSSKKQKH